MGFKVLDFVDSLAHFETLYDAYGSCNRIGGLRHFTLLHYSDNSMSIVLTCVKSLVRDSISSLLSRLYVDGFLQANQCRNPFIAKIVQKNVITILFEFVLFRNLSINM